MRLTVLEMKFLNSLDLIFLEINNGLKDRPISIKVTNRLRVKLKNPKLVVFGNRKAKVSERSWGGRFKYQEI